MKQCTCKHVQSKIEHTEQPFQSAHTGQGIKEDDPKSFHAVVEKICQYYFDLLDISSYHASALPWVSLDQIATIKVMHMHTSPRRDPHKTNYLESDSSNKEKSDENASLDDLPKREKKWWTLLQMQDL